MYGTQSFNEKVVMTRKHNDNYDVCNTEMGQKFIVQWSPQNGARYLSRNRYSTPRSLSKSVPRRNKGLVRYNINRSLNFDIGARRRSDGLNFPKSNSDCNLSVDNDNYLPRSAKILRALNINCSPLKSAGSGIRRINKSLNFDLSPSPKSIAKLNKSMRNSSLQNLVSPLSKINKTLNFESSSGESSVNSRLDSSVESIDENQNQTPSQRYRKAKKSLNYPSPNLSSSNSSSYSPKLRNDLRAKIDSIIQINGTPNFQSSKRNLMKNKHDDFGTSTPRNLMNDFRYDGDEDEAANVHENSRAQTPENFIKIIPESMSAIKKSHKKERILGRLGKAISYQTENYPHSEFFINAATKTEPEEKKLATSLNSSNEYESPRSVINSIKQLYKDKSKNSCLENSADEISETGSLFDYTDETNMMSENFTNIDKSVQDTDILERRDFHVIEDEIDEKNSSNDKVSSHTDIQVADKLEIVQGPSTSIENSSDVHANDDNVPTISSECNGNSVRPGTPENRVNILQRIMTDSIKKSHKKIKDKNKKLLFKSRNVQTNNEEDQNKISVNEDNAIAINDDRAATPENTNSSRLLLSQFSSVKKSHKKDKHRRMVSGSLQRKKFFGRDGESVSKFDSEIHNSSLSSSCGDFSSLSPPKISLDGVSSLRRCKINSHEFSSSDNSSDVDYHSLERSPLESDSHETGIDALPNSDDQKSSPNKRKNSFDDTSLTHQSSTNEESICYESAEEEFKIFTPIKKRKSLNLIAPKARRICDSSESLPEVHRLSEMENVTTRCSTPTMARDDNLKLIEDSFKTPDRTASNVVITITDYSTPVSQETENGNNDSDGGRLTPQNQSTAVLMAEINSIKKSHKKDKRGNVSRRFLMSAQENLDESKFTMSCMNDSLKSSQTRESPQPSTSYEIPNDEPRVEPENERDSEEVKTPPNCLQAKNYLRLLRTESIKRSHKKVRERKKYRSSVVNSELSDDGSIFDETERSLDMDNEGSRDRDEDKSNNTEQSRNSSLETYFLPSSLENKDHHFQDTSSHCDNLSHDGLSFDPEEKLDSPCKNGKVAERGEIDRP